MYVIFAFMFSAVLFTVCGFYQMAVWALGKHRNYKKEFKDYPRSRTSIVPFLI
jgi:very-long-chain enoyl-CoA reductase